MNVFDKASWHIDGGENEKEVVDRFRKIFQFLSSKGWLTDEGIETFEVGMDSSVSLNSDMVTDQGNAFLTNYYDSILDEDPKDWEKHLEEAYQAFCSE
ncbi:hypothetical protein [Pseudoramibacter sp.]|jgi:hypothetical protein|uniref:hypothetical protein n=1 Tax=Pseudoramibacter sp. TaxID=2034862 RepID=UPI0025EFF83D|nr:hypothetical protein [Pseudoramibacter sp.]MCH4071832.1 hypothetical protein [Pseudoramibacter sp.]MCH4105601.1 hypothetical protein [Pseudoramibacter sp.]